MKSITAVSIIHEGNNILVNHVVEREIVRQRQDYERKMQKLANAIEGRDKVDEKRHEVLGKRLAELERQMRPAPSITRVIKEYCIFTVVGLVAVGEFIIGR